MKYMKETLDFQLNKRSVVTLGKFDGLHRGHNKLLEKTLELGTQGLETVVFTFDVSPLVRLGTKIKRTILTNSERKVLLEKKGMDCLIECPFVPEVIQMQPEDFVKKILVEQLKAAVLVVGTDFRFGYERRGNVEMLKELGKKYGYQVLVLSKETEGHREISSTWIRETLREGKMERVNDLLGYPYFVQGKVVRGRQLGRTIGLPTINQVPPDEKLLPPFGVYATKSYIAGKEFYGITNVGVKPTVKVSFAGVETYLFSCNENLYDQEAWVEFFHFIRPECKFDSLEELKGQIQRDALTGKTFFREFM